MQDATKPSATFFEIAIYDFRNTLYIYTHITSAISKNVGILTELLDFPKN
jgi:hypothetical protein